MELYAEILAQVLQHETIEVTFPGLELSAAEIVQSSAYQALQKIRSILDDESLNDAECFLKIEEIISVFESMGIGTSRHDFG